MEIGDKVTYAGTTAVWVITEFGITPGRELSSGYWEAGWSWAALKRADGEYPDFINRVSVSSLRPVGGGSEI
jgi:hypothetical protein